MNSVLRHVVAVCLFLGVAMAQAAAISFGDLDLRQGFSFAPNVQNPFGYLSVLKIGSTTLKGDIAVSPGGMTYPPVAAVLKSVNWNGGVGDPIVLTAVVTAANKQALAAMLRSPTDISVDFGFAVYSFDPMSRNWFVGFSAVGNKSLKGTITKAGRDLGLMLGHEPDPAVPNPQNWEISLSVTPTAAAQNISLCNSPQQCVQKRWGVTVK